MESLSRHQMERSIDRHPGIANLNAAWSHDRLCHPQPHPLLDDLIERSRGFLRQLRLRETGCADAILIQGRFSPESYADDLFEMLGVPWTFTLSKAMPKRRADFLAGRALAQAAFQILGRTALVIPVGPDRAPVWPDGSVGSISHTQAYCACFVVLDRRWQVGVDAEEPARGQALTSLLETVLNEPERVLVTRQSVYPENCLATLIFSAKETLFKALSSTVGRFFGFDCAELRALPVNRQLTLYLTQPLAPFFPRNHGFDIRFEITFDHLLTWLMAPSARPEARPPVPRSPTCRQRLEQVLI